MDFILRILPERITQKRNKSLKHVILTPFNSIFYIVNWGLQEYLSVFLFLLKNILIWKKKKKKKKKKNRILSENF